MSENRRIAYVTDGLSPWVVGGMQGVARRQTEWLAESGYEVTIFHGMSEDAQIQGLAMHRLPWPKPHLLTKLNPWHYAQELRTFSESVDRAINELSPDLVYSEGPLITAYLSRRNGRYIPTIFHPHGLEMFQDMKSALLNFRSYPLRHLVSYHAFNSDVVLSQGGDLTCLLIDKLKIHGRNVKYHPNCVPLDFPFACQHRFDHRRRFAFVGRPDPRKGLNFLLKAFEQPPPGATLDVVGVSEHSRNLGSVMYHGTISDKNQLVETLDRCDFLVVPSLADGMATVIIEAFARAIPVIATSVGATRELVLPEKTGWLVPPSDTRKLTEALWRASSITREQYANMSSTALQLARTRFSPRVVKAEFLNIISELIEGATRRLQ